MTPAWRIVSAGDASLAVLFEERIDAAVASSVARLADEVRRASLPGVLDVVPTFRSLSLHFDPLKTDVGLLEGALGDLLSRPVPEPEDPPMPIRIPVCYGGTWGADLAHVAACSGVDESAVVALHTATTYRVFMLGFAPGFAYLGTVDPRIAVPRRSSPRTKVPAGSVAIAGDLTGIYPLDTPGGWQLIGRTTVRPFDPGRHDPFLFAPGQRVQFYSVESSEFDGAADHLQPRATA